MRTSAEPFRAVAVCTGNVCRSPQCAQILQARLVDHAPSAAEVVEITSAGIHPAPGATMPAEAAELSVRHGGDPTGHRARPADPAKIAAADLVLCMTRRQRQSLVRSAPRATRHTFLLTEFAHLLDDLAALPPEHGVAEPEAPVPDRLRAVVRAAGQRRGLTTLEGPEQDDVIDPYGEPEAVYRASAQQIVDCIGTMQSALGVILACSDAGATS